MVAELLTRLGVPEGLYNGGTHAVCTPIDGSQIAALTLQSKAQVTAKIDQAEKAFQAWRNVPAP
ncbi:aldehyde dehydrogenase family protein, partial [Pseudomonas donghuensis]|nr:aldehyde dehydrogenase family protein [Pseudomonas donghuensis]